MPSANAIAPTAQVTEVPGRYAPVYVVDKRNMSTVASSTTTNSLLAHLVRAESANATFQTPTTDVVELGANFNVGAYDDLPEAKLTITNYDVGYANIALLTGKDAPASSTTTWGFSDLASTSVDVVRQFADPNGNIFASMYMGDMFVEEFSISLKNKSAIMESYSLTGFNMALVKNFIVTKAYVVQSADVTAHSFSISAILGTDEAPVPIPVPGGGSPAAYWIQRGSLNFFKIERWRAGVGFVRFPEISTGTPAVGQCKWTSGSSTLSFNSAASELVAGDVFLLTYWTHECDVANYTTIPQLSLDTSDPVAVSTRLTPFTVSGQPLNSHATGVDVKMGLKRDRAEGIGDVDGLYGPPDAPTLDITLDTKFTDFSQFAVMVTGSPYGTDTTGTSAGDFFDPNFMTRVQLNSDAPLVVSVLDPRSAGTTIKTYTSPTPYFSNFDVTAGNKAPTTVKFTGKDRVGNFQVSVTRA